MKLHRFYLKDKELGQTVWLDSGPIAHQLLHVLRVREGQEIAIFNDEKDRLYKIVKIDNQSIKLSLVTEMERKLPRRDVYLFFSLLKKDKNEWVLQKCTELGVNHFVPILSERTEKTGFNMERAEKIVIEAAEQCGRSNIPRVRDPIEIPTAITEFSTKTQLFFAEETIDNLVETEELPDAIGLFVGPEGGWTESEVTYFIDSGVFEYSLGSFTLRAETACVIGAGKLLQ